MVPTPEEASDIGARGSRCWIRLPSEGGSVWILELPSELAKCVGSYARLPEFARDGHLLEMISLPAGKAS